MRTPDPLAVLDHSGGSSGEDTSDDANLGVVTCPQCGCEFDPETGQVEDATGEGPEGEAAPPKSSSSPDEGSPSGPPEKKMPKSFFALMGYGRKK